MRLFEYTVEQAVEGLKGKKFSSEELTASCLSRINEVEEKIKAFVTVDEKGVLAQAKEADKLISQGKDVFGEFPLLGIPMAVKDNFCTKGLTTTASAKILGEFIPPYDATVVKRLKEARAVILGKTNLDAWAHGSSTEYSDFFTTRNPWDTTRLPGGSSGGSAAAVSANEVIAAIGSETAGSIRQPAAWCGVVGLKPTYGRVSRYGLIAMASSLDSPGPIAKTVEDAAIILSVLAGRDPFDATTFDALKPKLTKNGEFPKIRIGIAESYFKDSQKEVAEVVEKTVKVFEKLGAKTKKIALLDPKYSIAVYTIVQRGEVSSNLARYDGIRYGRDRNYFGDEAKRRIMLGTYTLSAGYYEAYYKKAQTARTLIIRDFEKAFREVDVIVGPTAPTTALSIGATRDQVMFGEIQDRLAEPSSLAGLPAISVPCGFIDGLPVGIQIIAPQRKEDLMLTVAFAFEKEMGLKNLKPRI